MDREEKAGGTAGGSGSEENRASGNALKDQILRLEGLDRLSAVLAQGLELDLTLRRCLEALLDIFGCDRAYFAHAPDPDAEFIDLPFSAYREPFAVPPSLTVPMDAFNRTVALELLESAEPLCYGPANPPPLYAEYRASYSLRSMMVVLLRPKTGKFWVLGLHQCTHAREWSAAEKLLMRDIAARLTEVLDNLLLFRDLKASEQRFRTLADSVPALIWIAGVDGLCHYFNEPWLRFRGRSLLEEAGEGWTEGVHPDDRERCLRTYRANFRERAPFQVEYRLLRHDGEYRWILDQGLPAYSPAGEFQGYIGSAMDVTPHRELEEQLRQSQKMQAVGRLAGGIAHDFNNLLTAITGYCALARSRLPESDPVQGDLEEIGKAGDRAAALTRRLLAYSRRQVLELRPVSLSRIVAEMEGMLARLLGEDIEFETSLDPALPEVLADPSQIEQVVMNLAVNARDAMPQGGRLALSTVFQAGPVAQVELRVEDTGIGIPKALQDQVFEPFFTTKEPGQGTGLGLSTVYGVVKQLGGTVELSSEEGKGASFSIRLPVPAVAAFSSAGSTTSPRPASAAPPPSGSAGPLGPGSSRSNLKDTPMPRDPASPSSDPAPSQAALLLVEDEDGVRKLAHLILSGAGYRVFAFGSGLEALGWAKDQPQAVDLLVTDVVMPGMGGQALSRALRELWPSLKVLYMSGYTDDAIMRQGLLEASSAFLHKPFTPQSLVEKVRDFLAP